MQTLHFDSFITASYASRLARYYSRQQTLSCFTTKYTGHALAHTLSTYDTTSVENKDDKDTSFFALTYSYQNHLYATDTSTNTVDYLAQTSQMLFTSFLNQLVSVYRILILTYLNTLKF